jgi:hypothetical protein
MFARCASRIAAKTTAAVGGKVINKSAPKPGLTPVRQANGCAAAFCGRIAR